MVFLNNLEHILRTSAIMNTLSTGFEELNVLDLKLAFTYLNGSLNCISVVKVLKNNEKMLGLWDATYKLSEYFQMHAE